MFPNCSELVAEGQVTYRNKDFAGIGFLPAIPRQFDGSFQGISATAKFSTLSQKATEDVKDYEQKRESAGRQTANCLFSFHLSPFISHVRSGIRLAERTQVEKLFSRWTRRAHDQAAMAPGRSHPRRPRSRFLYSVPLSNGLPLS